MKPGRVRVRVGVRVRVRVRAEVMVIGHGLVFRVEIRLGLGRRA